MSWFWSPSTGILEPKKIKSVSYPPPPSLCHEVMGPDAMILIFWILSFSTAFSLSFFTLIKRPFSFSSPNCVPIKQLPICPALVNHCFTFHLYELDYFGCFIWVESYDILFCFFYVRFPFWMDLTALRRRRQWYPTPVLLSGKSHGLRSLVSCSLWGCKEWDTTERLHFHFALSCIGEGNGNLLQCSCLENPRDRGAWWAAVSGVAQSRTWLKWLSSSSSSSCFIDYAKAFDCVDHNKL